MKLAKKKTRRKRVFFFDAFFFSRTKKKFFGRNQGVFRRKIIFLYQYYFFQAKNYLFHPTNVSKKFHKNHVVPKKSIKIDFFDEKSTFRSSDRKLLNVPIFWQRFIRRKRRKKFFLGILKKKRVEKKTRSRTRFFSPE